MSREQGLRANAEQRFAHQLVEAMPGIFYLYDDRGRFLLTGDTSDDRVFKVPSLRNVAVTAPYFHDGSVPTLDGAVLVMARLQLGRQLTRVEVQRLVAFLGTLTGEYQGQPLT